MALSAVFVRDAEAALRMLPTDIVACDVAGTTFHARIICDCYLVLLPLVHVGWADSDADEVEGTFYTHFRIFDP